jgi:hypothetical protein
MTRASENLFDGIPEKWPTFENHLIRGAGNTTIGWSKDILSLNVMGQELEINFLENYVHIPENMV